jgi:hypothetical protein
MEGGISMTVKWYYCKQREGDGATRAISISTSATPVLKPAPAKISWLGFKNAGFAKFGCDLAGPDSKLEVLNGPSKASSAITIFELDGHKRPTEPTHSTSHFI